MKIGDQVRFLSEKGGGRVVGFQKGGIVLVEDADGFEIPMLATELVVVGNENYDTAKCVDAATSILIPLRNMINEAYALDIGRKVKASQRQMMKEGQY